jgi:hypothetical protein
MGKNGEELIVRILENHQIEDFITLIFNCKDAAINGLTYIYYPLVHVFLKQLVACFEPK